jgi:hypothetical protein
VKLEVVVLPHHLFQRYYLGHAHDPVLVHPLANQKGKTKMESLDRLGLVSLRPDWESLLFTKDSLGVLDRDSAKLPYD